MSKTFLIVGGYGNTGFQIAELLLLHTDSNVIIAGRNKIRAQETSDELNKMFSGNRVHSLKVDAANQKSLETAFNLADMAVMASSTMEYVESAVKAALTTGTDYLDTQLSNHQKLNTLKSFKTEILRNERLFITDAGFHPGVPAALVRYAAKEMNELVTGNIYSTIRLDWNAYSFSESTVLEMVNEFKDYKPQIIKNREWVTLAYKNMPKYDFGYPVGKTNCIAMVMNEFEELLYLVPSLQETGFYIAGFNGVTDYLITPIVMLGLKWFPKSEKKMGKLFQWSLQKFSKPPFITMLNLEADGFTNDKKSKIQINLMHTDGYFLTAVPVVACLKQYNEGTIKQTGLWYQANIVDPVQFIRDIDTMGIKTEIKKI